MRRLSAITARAEFAYRRYVHISYAYLLLYGHNNARVHYAYASIFVKIMGCLRRSKMDGDDQSVVTFYHFPKVFGG